MSFAVANIKIVLRSHEARLTYWCTVCRLEVTGSQPSVHTNERVYVTGRFIKHNPYVRVNKRTVLHVNRRHGGWLWYVGVQHNKSAYTRKQKQYNRVTNLAVVRACPVKQQNLFSYNATILCALSLSFVLVLSVSQVEEEKKAGIQVHRTEMCPLWLPVGAVRCNLMSVWIWIRGRGRGKPSQLTAIYVFRTCVCLPVFGVCFTEWPETLFLISSQRWIRKS